MKNEIWKDIPGYEGLYQVSDQGNIKSLDRYVIQNNLGGPYEHFYKGKIMTKSINKKTGYIQVQLRAGKKSKWFLLHRLVAITFIPNPNSLPEVDHINTIKTDCRASNLKWTDRQGNADNPITKQRQKEVCSKIGKIYGKIWGPINNPYNKKTKGLVLSKPLV